MKESIKAELTQHLNEYMKENELTPQSEDLHHKAFGEDYYLIGYYECSEWLKKHNLGEFEALEELYNLQELHYGEIQKLENINSETVVNQLVYLYSMELC